MGKIINIFYLLYYNVFEIDKKKTLKIFKNWKFVKIEHFYKDEFALFLKNMLTFIKLCENLKFLKHFKNWKILTSSKVRNISSNFKYSCLKCSLKIFWDASRLF